MNNRKKVRRTRKTKEAKIEAPVEEKQTATEVMPAKEIKAASSTAESIKVTRDYRKWVWLSLGGLCFVSGLGISILWITFLPLNHILGFSGLGLMGAGGYLLWNRIITKGERDKRIAIVKGEKPSNNYPANTCNITVEMVNGKWIPKLIEFVQMDNPAGPWQYVEELKNYYCFNQVWEKNGETVVKPLQLQENRSGLTPRELIVPVKRAHFEDWMKSLNQMSMLQKIAPGILLIAMLILVIAIIAVE